MYKYIIFDLDGTIINSEKGVTRCTAFALKHFAIEEKPENLKHFIGPPLHYSFEHFYSLSESEVQEAVRYFRERYQDKGILECELYPGIKDCLKELSKQGKILAVATSKYEPYAVRILENFGISKYFSEIVGSSYGVKFSQKADLIAAVLERLGVDGSQKSNAVMVGDTAYDIIGANTVSIDSIGVSYGFGSRSEMAENEASYIVDSVKALNDLLSSV